MEAMETETGTEATMVLTAKKIMTEATIREQIFNPRFFILINQKFVLGQSYLAACSNKQTKDFHVHC